LSADECPVAIGAGDACPVDSEVFGIFNGDAVFALSKRKEVRSELAMRVRAVARLRLMRFWHASLRILDRN